MSDPADTAARADSGLVARLASKARGLSELNKAITAERDTFKGQVADLQKQVTELSQRADTSAASKRVEELTAELRGLRHRQVFERVASKLDALPGATEDIWQLSGYKPEADQVDEPGLEKFLGEFKAKKAYLFKSADSAAGDGSAVPAEPPKPGPASGRGAPAAAPGKFAVKPSDIRDPRWWNDNSKGYLEAVKANNVHWLPE